VSDDRLELLRHELADVEQAIADSDIAPAPLLAREDELRAEILELERAAREEIGVQPAPVEGAEPARFRNPAADLVVPSLPPGTEELVHATNLVLDRADEDQVISMLEDRYDPVLFYDFRRSGERVEGLSVKGIYEAVRLLNATGHARIRSMPDTVMFGSEHRDAGRGTEEFVVCTIAAADDVSGLMIAGTAMEPVLMRLRTGQTKFDVYCRAKALSKAQRNALAGHVPERVKQAMLAMYKGLDARVLEIKHGAGAQAVAELPPPVDSPRAKELEREAKEIYADIKLLPGWQRAMLPGKFNAEFSRARSSEAALEAFVNALLSLREALHIEEGE
jgi:hypothetical protein